MSHAAVQVEDGEQVRGGRIALVTVDNRTKLNCLSTPLIVELAEAFARLGGTTRLCARSS